MDSRTMHILPEVPMEIAVCKGFVVALCKDHFSPLFFLGQNLGIYKCGGGAHGLRGA